MIAMALCNEAASLVTSRRFEDARVSDREALHDTLAADELSKLIAEGSTWDEDRAVAEAMRI